MFIFLIIFTQEQMDRPKQFFVCVRKTVQSSSLCSEVPDWVVFCFVLLEKNFTEKLQL